MGEFLLSLRYDRPLRLQPYCPPGDRVALAAL